jgi:hypothetical protein
LSKDKYTQHRRYRWQLYVCEHSLRKDAPPVLSSGLARCESGDARAAREMLAYFTFTMQQYRAEYLFPKLPHRSSRSGPKSGSQAASEIDTSLAGEKHIAASPDQRIDTPAAGDEERLRAILEAWSDERRDAAINWGNLNSDLEACAEGVWRTFFRRGENAKMSRARLRGKVLLHVPLDGLREEPQRDGAGGRTTREHSSILELTLSPRMRNSDRALDEQRRLTELASYARIFLLMHVEASFYRFRMESNYQALGIQTERAGGNVSDRAPKVVEDFKTILRAFRGTLRKWDNELDRNVGLRPFRTLPGEAQHIRLLGSSFGSNHILSEERGWGAYAGPVGDELRYEYLNALLRERWRRVRTWLSAFWLTLLKATTGFGLRPKRLAIVVVLAIATFSGLYTLSDAVAGTECQHYPVSSNWPDILGSLLSHIYVALTNLTGLGSSPDPCGPGFQIIQGAETITGYFLLAILASLLVQQITDIDT